MALVTLTFTNQPLNASCQVGDTVYYVSTTNTLKGATNDFLVEDGTGITEIGVIVEIANPLTTPVITVRAIDSYPGTSSTLTNKFIFFSKDNKANLSSPLGYYASVKLRNNSLTEGEIHAVGMEMFESRK